ncbi:unnamed protein product, partial [Effrenium voratum]
MATTPLRRRRQSWCGATTSHSTTTSPAWRGSGTRASTLRTRPWRPTAVPPPRGKTPTATAGAVERSAMASSAPRSGRSGRSTRKN